jgi:N-acetyl-gamma-glutamyl-phosphate reductase
MSYKVAVVGAAGYAGIELVRLVLNHPRFELVLATSDGDAGSKLASLYPALTGITDLQFEPHNAAWQTPEIDIAFLAVPHTAAVAMAPQLLARDVCVFDLSADFRLKDADVYEQWYGVKHTAKNLLEAAVYGLPELNRAQLETIASPALVACPGCYPTASALAVVPALKAGLNVKGPAIINALSGVSGAGRKSTEQSHFCQADSNAKAYGVTTHRHTPEIAQTYSQVAGSEVSVLFTPHLVPMKRGLEATVVLPLKSDVTIEQLAAVYTQTYAVEPFVEFLPPGQMPATASVVGSNRAQVGIALDTATQHLVASCVIDNLGKGAASQAIQCANIVMGLNETSGLEQVSAVV